ncbi:hypothetical protein DVH24_002422 [Malus domestica]|uniref:Uncharacterized protein n=1 Tax=Malus domestica TaxID=3750 RepID=A0A498IHK5_MALDO|nr:hypothetical protein DVH24_002422 [Malus domestica]
MESRGLTLYAGPRDPPSSRGAKRTHPSRGSISSYGNRSSELPKGLMLGKDGNILRITPLDDVGCYIGPKIFIEKHF